MAESSPVPAAPRRRFRKRRWLALAGAAVLLLMGAIALLWQGRVSVLNRIFSVSSSVWRVELEGLNFAEGRWVVQGLKVRHQDQADPVFSAERVVSDSGWQELRQGRLGNVELWQPKVFWRSGLRGDPRDPLKSKTARPLLSWQSLKISGGQLDLASAGNFSLTGGLQGEGGSGWWQEDGGLSLSKQKLALAPAGYRMWRQAGPLKSLTVHAGEVVMEASVDAATGWLTVHGAEFAGARAEAEGRLPMAKSAAPSAGPGRIPVVDDPAKSAPESAVPERSTIAGVTLHHLKAPGFEGSGHLPWETSVKGGLSLDFLEAGAGKPFGMTGAQLTQGSIELPAGTQLPEVQLSLGFREGEPVLESLSLRKSRMPDAAGLLEQIGWPLPSGMRVALEAEADLKELRWMGDGLKSSELQRLNLGQIRVHLPEEWGEVEAKALTIEAVPDEVATERRLRKVELVRPVANLLLPSLPAALAAGLGGNLPSAPPVVSASKPEKSPDPAGVPPAPAGAAPRPAWEGWTADSLTVTEGNLSAVIPQAGGGKFLSAFAVSTIAPQPDSVSPAYRIQLDAPRLIHPELAEQPVALAGVIQLTASAAGLWQKRELDTLTVTGSRIQIGEALFRLVQSMPPGPPESPVPPPTSSALPMEKAPPWRLGHVVLEDSLIQLDHLGDGRRLDIPIKRQEFRDLPLDPVSLAAVDRVYQIEVPNITLYNPFNAGQKVAVLDTNFIRFTPSGLLARRLERVDLMSPSLYAGQPLFDFVDATRKRFAALASAPANPATAGKPLLVDNLRNSPAFLSALASVSPSEAAQAADWHIPFYTGTGKVYVAPKGIPWPNLPVIPFRNARDTKGNPVPFLLKGETFHGELAIEPGWYDFPEYKVRLRLSDRGRIVFNTPQKDRDNNLTEVFEKNTLIFRQIRVDDAWLSITYDARGIYAIFGGRTCGGTLSGGLNLYLDEMYTWDAWASLVGIGMKPLTDKLTPESFRMDGPIDELTIKAYGDTTTLYQAALDLKVSRPGQLQILALDGLRQSIEALGGMQADLGRIGVETLRDFAYTGCRGNLRLFGTEGQGELVLTGPEGSRTFRLRLMDYRARVPRSMVPF